jgi:hypothetical protein
LVPFSFIEHLPSSQSVDGAAPPRQHDAPDNRPIYAPVLD